MAGSMVGLQLTLKGHHTTRLKEGRKAMTRLRRLTGQRRASGREVRPRNQSTACQRARSPMARWPVAPRGSPRGTTS